MRTVSIIGVGRVGGALAIALDRAGFAVDTLVYRSTEAIGNVTSLLSRQPKLSSWENLLEIDSEVLIIASGDPEIAVIAEKIAGFDKRPVVAFHTSGSLSSDILSPLRDKGVYSGSIHPLVSISDPVIGAERFSGSYFCIEGDKDALAVAELMVEQLGGRSFSIETADKPLYHASAVTACGHLVALIDVATEMLSKCGMSNAQAKTVLMPLIESTLANLKIQDAKDALTGTFARGDIDAFKRHLAAFEGRISDEDREIYLLLGQRSIEIAMRGEDALPDFAEAILIAKQKHG
ncbi:MAG TPA: Rossmann-like and DUF2520 domain-containing protein [Pyrinomonadaceae bacterium]|nr:Rossmann-like and DUF2520 domain-containing protein [Pyrinomonadaceae bacterium]